jgi:hypothetical protein
MRKRSLILLLLPLILIIWTIGWAFLWAGERDANQKQQLKQEPNIETTVQLPQQEQEITE